MTEQTSQPATGEQPSPEQSSADPSSADTSSADQGSTDQSSADQSSADQSGAKRSRAVKARSEPVARTRRPGKPKLDALLAEAVDLAHDALYEIADPEQVGAHLGVTAEGDRLLTHRFAAAKSGYRGWEWFVTVARAPRAKLVTVCEIGLLPGEDALIAPEWVPWLERMNEEERQAHQAEQAEADEA